MAAVTFCKWLLLILLLSCLCFAAALHRSLEFDTCTDRTCVLQFLQRLSTSISFPLNDKYQEEPIDILFVGNSFTYGPASYDEKNKSALNNLPRLFKFIAESFGLKVRQAEDTIGGCTLYMHRPSMNSESTCENGGCRVVNLTRISAQEGCSVSSKIRTLRSSYAPCPQRFKRQPFGHWDIVVLQDFSTLPSIKGAREKMFLPSIAEYAVELKRQAKEAQRMKEPILALFMTWAYPEGSFKKCPEEAKKGCTPVGSLRRLSKCKNGAWYNKTSNEACQSYSLARGYADGLRYGAQVFVPAGLAWQMARGSFVLPPACKEQVDLEYDVEGPLSNMQLPLKASNVSNVLWKGDRGLKLFRYMGPDYISPYCQDCHVDHHPSATGVYLNALVFFSTLFKKSPIGAAIPTGTEVVDGLRLPAIDPIEGRALQHIAHDVVMPHLDVWWQSQRNGVTVGV